MKQIYLFLLMSIFSLANAQTYSGDVKLTSSGGGFVSGHGYTGNVSVGLPFVGIIKNDTTDMKVGMFGNNNKTELGVDKITSQYIELKTYPNPTTGKVSLIFDASISKIVSIYLVDVVGRLTTQIPYTIFAGHVQVYLGDKPNGTYLLRIEYEKTLVNYKVTLLK